jgi:hypothetical protein
MLGLLLSGLKERGVFFAVCFSIETGTCIFGPKGRICGSKKTFPIEG